MSLQLQENLWTPPTKTNPHKSWCFTINNYTPEDLRFVKNLECQRLAVGEEVGENGTPHLQGFVIFKKGYRFSGMKKIFPRAHLQIAKSWQHAWNYCIKDGKFHIVCNSTQGKRNDIIAYRDAIKNGHSDRELCDEFPHEFLKFNRTDRMRRAYIEPRNWMTKCLWIHGPAGSGKSTYIKQKYNFADIDWLEYDGKYFSSYYNRDVVVLDDIDMDLISRSLFLKMVNHIPYKLRVMGSYQEFNPKLIVIITNDSPSSWRYYYDEAVKRRITEEKYWTKEEWAV